MKPKENLFVSTTKMKLNRSSSSVQKCKDGSLKLLFLMLYFVSLCSTSFGEEVPPQPKFLVENKDCGKYVHPRIPPNCESHDGTALFIWEGTGAGCSQFDFVPVHYEKWGYIRHIKSGRFWHPQGDPRKKDTKIGLAFSKGIENLFQIDQAKGHIKHKRGLYVHYQKEKCNNGDNLHLHDKIHERMEWKFVNPDKAWEEVLPYGYFTAYAEWILVFAVMNSATATTIEYTVKEGRSTSESITDQFAFSWQYSASASNAFASVSTSASFTQAIETSSLDTWSQETSLTLKLQVNKGESVAVWQMVFCGEQLGNKEVFQSKAYAHTDSIYTKPNHDNSGKFTIEGQRSTFEDINFDEDGVFALHTYSIIEDVDAEPDVKH